MGSKGDIGVPIKPSQPHTRSIKKILEEYPDGSQILREILQNSDDAKSRRQIFILDHNSYPTKTLFKPKRKGTGRNDLKLDRYQGPALLSKNDTIFEERDFESLCNFADSEKKDQFDKIGVMGVGFNSIYHITDSPSFITGDNYVILDPHKWYYKGGFKFKFVKAAIDHPDQFAPFRIPCDREFNGTFFRYPLRTSEDAIDSAISKKVYRPDDILEMFQKFYENEGVNCLLFLKYIEVIEFYELKEGETEPKLLYAINIENADEIRSKRQLIVRNIVPMMESLGSNNPDEFTEIESTFVVTFCRQKEQYKSERVPWIIFNWLDDINAANNHFRENFKKDIKEYKFVPNVGLAMQLNNNKTNGRLFCFLPLPILMPFRTSVHGYFAVSTNRRTLWTPADSEDLAADALARLKASWNKYLFDSVLPKAWARFLTRLPYEYPSVQSTELINFWPILSNQIFGSVTELCKELLENVVKNLGVNDEVFIGPSTLYSPGNMHGLLSEIDNTSYTKKKTKFRLLSIANGYFIPESASSRTSEILGKIGFPVIININMKVENVLKQSRHKSDLQFYSPKVVRTYLHQNYSRWRNLPREEILTLFDYVLRDEDLEGLDGLQMIPLADGTLGTISQANKNIVYVCPDYNSNEDCDESKLFAKDLEIFIDNAIPRSLWNRLHDGAKGNWNLNIKILTASVVANLIVKNLEGYSSELDEIKLRNQREWVCQIWNNFMKRNYDLKDFEYLHLLLTNRGTLRKIRANEKCFWHITNDKLENKIRPIIEKFDAVFIDKDFEKRLVHAWLKLAPYVIELSEVPSVLSCLHESATYPKNLEIHLRTEDASEMMDYLSNHLNDNSKITSTMVEVIKNFPIFSEIDQQKPIPLHKNKEWLLLPREDERDYGRIITPGSTGFLDARSKNTRHVLEDIVKISRLPRIVYWSEYVIPHLISQPLPVLEFMVEKLFDRLGILLHSDSSLKTKLALLPFVTGGTLKMFNDRQNSDAYVMCKPIDLYNPNDRRIIELFFEYEKVFPAGKFTVSSPQKLRLLTELGLKTYLSQDDIIDRINIIKAHRDAGNKPEFFRSAHTRALRLIRYIDEKWEDVFGRNQGPSEQFLSEILSNEWIPTVDHQGRNHFSKPSFCRDTKQKLLIGYAVPILDYRIKNAEFIKCLGWNKNPEVRLILRQLQVCSQQSEIQNIYDICKMVYSHMNRIVTESDQSQEVAVLKKGLEHKKWIFIDGQFYTSENVLFDVPRNFGNRDTLIVELPYEYRTHYKKLFQSMGVRLKIGIQDYVNIIKAYPQKVNSDVELPDDEVNKIVGLIDQISRIYVEDKSSPEMLQGLLVPNTQGTLVDLTEIQYDDMGTRLTEEERKSYFIAHPSISLNTARNINMQMLSGKVLEEMTHDEFMPEFYEQQEHLTNRIRNIIHDYPLSSIFKEFLQNADDAGARVFKVYIDEREFPCFSKYKIKREKHGSLTGSLLTEEMNLWQGPALWIYNDAEFSEEDFSSLIRLGSSDKAIDKTKIGRFGVGFNSAFNLTDLPSFVSGEHIVFLDPHSKYLPALGNPPRKPLGNKYNFIKTKFREKWHDQAIPYLSMEGCDLKTKYHGTLFRIPLRTEQSMISDRLTNAKSVLDLLRNIRGNREMLFLRNIEECSVFKISQSTGWGTSDKVNIEPIWKASIKNLNEHIKKMRNSINYEIKLFQLEIETERTENRQEDQRRMILYRGTGKDKQTQTRGFERWLICFGGNAIREDLKAFSKSNKVMPRGGVAALVAESSENGEELTYSTNLKGEMYSYLSLSIKNNLSVMLNGDFCLSSDRKNILQTDKDAADEKVKWNRYLLADILPPLHAKLLDEIAIRDLLRFKSMHQDSNDKFTSHLMTRDWPIVDKSGIYRNFGLTVFQNVAQKGYRVFWTEANGGELVSFKDAIFAESEKEPIVLDIFIRQNIRIVKVSGEQYKHLEELSTHQTIRPNFITRDLVRNGLYVKKNIWDTYLTSGRQEEVKRSVSYLLKLILEGVDLDDVKSYRSLVGLPLVPLCDGTIGTFCEKEYYIAEEKHRNLFSKTKASHFVSEPPFDVENKAVSELLKISKLDAKGVLNLLEFELPRIKEMEWNPSGDLYPNKEWIERILEFFNKESTFDFDKFAEYPLLPMVLPQTKLIRFGKTNSLLLREKLDYTLIEVLSKLGVGFTDLKLADNVHPTLAKCVAQANKANIFICIWRAKVLSQKSMDQLFKQLDSNDISKLRTLVKDFLVPSELKFDKLDSGIKTHILGIIRNLPIWPVHSSDDFIDAYKGHLLKSKLKPYSFFHVKIFITESNKDSESLTLLKAKIMTELEYVKSYYEHMKVTPNDEYLEFLKQILLLGNSEVENYLSKLYIIPNKDLSELCRADAFYDISVSLFRDIFRDTNKFLPMGLQENQVVLRALGRMGLKWAVNSSTFIECAREIERKFQTAPTSVVKSLARMLIMELYSRHDELSFDSRQWEELLTIKFAPADTNLPEHYRIQTDDIVSLDSVCFFKYKDLVWTQIPLLDRLLDPPKNLLVKHPNLCEPKLWQVIDHWYKVALEISQTESTDWKSHEGQNRFRDVMKEIYEYMNNGIDEENEIYIESRIQYERLFLNGDDPFERDSWVAGSNLVYNVSEDIGQGLHKVSKFLEKYKPLLELAGAKELENIEKEIVMREHDQKNYVMNELLGFFESQERTPHHDVAFCFPNNEKVYANRYVLSAATQYFRSLFSGHMSESAEFQRVITNIDDFEPDTFRILIRWLYGQPFEKALKAVLTDLDDCVTTLIDLLKASNKYQIDAFKEILENAIVDQCNANNVIEIKKWAEHCNAEQLDNHCKRYIKKNKSLLVQKRMEDMEDEQDEEMLAAILEEFDDEDLDI